jgi:hypothetical protein
MFRATSRTTFARCLTSTPILLPGSPTNVNIRCHYLDPWPRLHEQISRTTLARCLTGTPLLLPVPWSTADHYHEGISHVANAISKPESAISNNGTASLIAIPFHPEPISLVPQQFRPAVVIPDCPWCATSSVRFAQVGDSIQFDTRSCAIRNRWLSFPQLGMFFRLQSR